MNKSLIEKISLTDLDNYLKSDAYLDRLFIVEGIVLNEKYGTSKFNTPYCIFTIEDSSGSFEFAMFNEKYSVFYSIIKVGKELRIVLCLKEIIPNTPYIKYLSVSDGETELTV